MAKKRKTEEGLTAAQLETVRVVASERGIDLPAGWQRERVYCLAFLERLSMSRRDNPGIEVVRFLNNVTREVEAGATSGDLARTHALPANFAATMHAYALKQLGHADIAEWESDLRRINEAFEDADA
jgi:hypothetical protein